MSFYCAVPSPAPFVQMTNSKPHNPSQAASSTPDNEPNQSTIPQPFVRIVVGLLGAIFIAPAFYVSIVMLTQQHAVAELSVFPTMLVGGIAVGWASFSQLVIRRVLAWSAAGLGAGLVLEAILMGGLAVGSFITLSGIILGIVGGVLGYRAQPLA